MWSGRNDSRWVSEAYADAYESLALTPIGPAREQLVLETNDLLVQEHVVIPLFQCAWVSVFQSRLRGVRLSPWGCEMWNIHEWNRE